MIHAFSVSNYGSIRDSVTLDLRIPGTAPDLRFFRRSKASPSIRLPMVAVLMGPNGSGKTTLLRAMVDLGRMASSIADPVNPVSFLSDQTKWEPTIFSLEGEANILDLDEAPQRFRYELTIERKRPLNGTASTQFISHEALLHFPNGRRSRLIERRSGESSTYVSRDLGLTARDARLKGITAERSAIATLALLNVPVAKRFADFMGATLAKSSNIKGYSTITPDTATVINWLKTDADMREWTDYNLQRSDLGIDELEIVETIGGSYLQFRHSGLDSPIRLDFESVGAQLMVHILPIIKIALDDTGMAILDEIDGDLHVDLLREIIYMFRSPVDNPRNSQLLISSHHSGLLEELEKEEFFIVEKSHRGVTQVYGAQEIQGLRRDVRLYSKYRAGVLGGLPLIG